MAAGQGDGEKSDGLPQKGYAEHRHRFVGIIGTGDFARALARSLLFSGYDVIFGSREPEKRTLSEIDKIFGDAFVTTVGSVLTNPEVKILFLAVHYAHYQRLISAYKDGLKGKILVDVSNRDKASETESNGENIQAAFPDVRVVKAFNTLSSYALESDTFGGSRRALVAGDDPEAREIVCGVARDMGLTPVDCGSLKAARRLESSPLKLFPGWGFPTVFALSMFLFWILVVVIKYLRRYVGSQREFTWSKVPLKRLNVPVCMTALNLLACAYLPGCLAAFLQLYSGTKYKRFPRWLDRWLRARKQIGLYALLFASLHAVISTVVMSPAYFGSWYKSTRQTVPANATQDINIYTRGSMSLRGELAGLTGIVSLILMSVLGFSTLPSVTEALNWREWRFVQSKLGYLTLVFAVAHVFTIGILGWVRSKTAIFLTYNTFLSSIVPFSVLLMKLILIIPWIDSYITKIRQGWERKGSKSAAIQLTNISVRSTE